MTNKLEVAEAKYNQWLNDGYAIDKKRGQAASHVGALKTKLRDAPELDTPGFVAIAEKKLRDLEVAIVEHARQRDALTNEVRYARRCKHGDAEWRHRNEWTVEKWGMVPSKIAKSLDTIGRAFQGDFPNDVGDHLGSLRNWCRSMDGMVAELNRIDNEQWEA